MSRLTFVSLSGFFSFLTIALWFHALEAYDDRGRFNYNNERGAWGGNGGWWGDSHYDWYGEYGTRDEYPRYSYYYPRTRRHYSNPYHPSQGHYYDGYYYHNEYPYAGQYFYDNSVDGGALYVNFR